jgi:hypothetical protein
MAPALSRNLNKLRHRIYDNHLKISGNLVGYNDVLLYNYSMEENRYGDQEKTLINVVGPLNCYIDFPGEVPNLTKTKTQSAERGSLLFIEDFLPILAYVPWYYTPDVSGVPEETVVPVNPGDVLQFKVYDEFDELQTLRFEIMERKSDYIESHVYREFVIAPERSDTIDFTEDDASGSPQPVDPNIEVGKENTEMYSKYE